MNKLTLLTTVLVAGALTAGCEATKGMANKAKAMTSSSSTAMMKLSDQPASDGVVIDVLVLAQPGFVVVHMDAGGKPGPVIGHSDLIAAGKHANVMVKFDSSKAGARVFPMVHNDNGDGVYEFPGPDGPTVVDGKVLVGPVNWK